MKVKRFAESTRKESDRKKRREEQKSQPSRRPAFLIYPPPRRAEGTSPAGSRDVQTRMNSTTMPHHLQTLRVTAPPTCQQGLAWPGGVPVLYLNYPLDDALHGASATLPMLDPHRASLIALLASRSTLTLRYPHRASLSSHSTRIAPHSKPSHLALHSTHAAPQSCSASVAVTPPLPLVLGPDTRGGGRRLDRDGMGWGAYVRLG
ncbi:unnamed protein product [Diplocarpon coronariae]